MYGDGFFDFLGGETWGDHRVDADTVVGVAWDGSGEGESGHAGEEGRDDCCGMHFDC